MFFLALKFMELIIIHKFVLILCLFIKKTCIFIFYFIHFSGKNERQKQVGTKIARHHKRLSGKSGHEN